MGWFWDSKSSDSASDPYSKLDPALREFLEKESPTKYQDPHPIPKSQERLTPTPSPDQAPTTYRSQLGLGDRSLTQDHQNADPKPDRPAVPPESLYQDGRYAHLWKNYRPQAEILAESQTDQDKMVALMESYRDRKAAIGRAALENCVMEQMTEKACFKSGNWKQLMTMCRTENRAFNRCYTMQSRFLKALGYLSNDYATLEEEEKIQMHADRLYHEMLEREKAMEEAKQAGRDAPVFDPLIQPENTTKALGEDSAWARARQRAQAQGISTNLSSYSLEKQKEIKEKLQGKSDQEKELELQLIAAESRAHLEFADKLRTQMKEEQTHRADRRERGKETVGDQMKRWAGWDNR